MSSSVVLRSPDSVCYSLVNPKAAACTRCCRPTVQGQQSWVGKCLPNLAAEDIHTKN